MNINITKLTSADCNDVDELMKRNSKTLGFLPQAVLIDYLERGLVLGAKVNDNRLVGYLLYARNSQRFRITHLCVSKDFRGQGIAKLLIRHLQDTTTTQTVMQLKCRRDYIANDIWPKLGFVPLDDSQGRSLAGHTLVFWRRKLATEKQLNIFELSDIFAENDRRNVVIDANIFYDIDDEINKKTLPSKELENMVEDVELFVTDELFVEINRNTDPVQREAGMQRAHAFLRAEYEPHKAEKFERLLERFLPHQTDSSLSDVRQLAKAAASSASIFVTRDRDILKKSKDILEAVGLRVVDPTTLIIEVHQQTHNRLYDPDSISGINFVWSRLRPEDRLDVIKAFSAIEKQRSGVFRQELDSFLARTDDYHCELLRLFDEIVAIRILDMRTPNQLLVHLVGVIEAKRPLNVTLIWQFVLANTLAYALNRKRKLIIIEKILSSSENISEHLTEMGFLKQEGRFLRVCLAEFAGREQIIYETSQLLSGLGSAYKKMSDLELLRYCSPVASAAEDSDYFLIPIQPHHAMNLFDYRQTSSNLFGGKPDILLRWKNVYYRTKTRHKMLAAPARILWYLSKPESSIVAISHLERVDLDVPKSLFSRFRKFGTLTWNDILQICHEDLSAEIMALQFSHTFLFRSSISLDCIRRIYREENIGLVLELPSRIPLRVVSRLFRKGYSDNQ